MSTIVGQIYIVKTFKLGSQFLFRHFKSGCSHQKLHQNVLTFVIQMYLGYMHWRSHVGGGFIHIPRLIP